MVNWDFLSTGTADSQSKSYSQCTALEQPVEKLQQPYCIYRYGACAAINMQVRDPSVLSPMTCTAFCLLHLPHFTLSESGCCNPQSKARKAGGRVKAEWPRRCRPNWSAGCSSQNAKLNQISSGRCTAGVQSWVHWSDSVADNISPCLFQLAHKFQRARTLAQPVFHRNQKDRDFLKQNVQFLSTIL